MTPREEVEGTTMSTRQDANVSSQLRQQIHHGVKHLRPLDLITFTLFPQTKLFDSHCARSNFFLSDHNPHTSTTLLGQLELFRDMSGLSLVLKFRLLLTTYRKEEMIP
jgi:hypothetical protein